MRIPGIAEMREGDSVVLRATVARANREQALIEFESMEGPFSVRVPLSELLRVSTADDAYAAGRKGATCDRDRADEWVEVDLAALDGLPKGAQVRLGWVSGDPTTPYRYFVHRDDLSNMTPKEETR